MSGTVLTPSLEGMKHIKSDKGDILTQPFLEVCKLILPVLDKFGGGMTIVKSDIGGNITRLQTEYDYDPSKFKYLYTLVQVEVEAKTAKCSSSCTNGLLWLTRETREWLNFRTKARSWKDNTDESDVCFSCRAMDFMVELFKNLQQHPDWNMSQVCNVSYSKTLKKWHGWFANYSFTVAMTLAPDRKTFMEVISGSGDINADMEKFCATFPPFLAENHKFLYNLGLDCMKAS